MRVFLAGLLERCPGSRSAPPRRERSRRAKINHRGRHFDLGEIFDRINSECFDGRVTAAITWGRRSGGKPRRSIRLGSYRREENLIRIHSALDAAFVPPYFIEALVHHEMLHALIPVVRGKNGRRVVHGRDFRERERGFAGYEQAKRWRRENMGLLLEC